MTITAKTAVDRYALTVDEIEASRLNGAAEYRTQLEALRRETRRASATFLRGA